MLVNRIAMDCPVVADTSRFTIRLKAHHLMRFPLLETVEHRKVSSLIEEELETTTDCAGGCMDPIHPFGSPVPWRISNLRSRSSATILKWMQCHDLAASSDRHTSSGFQQERGIRHYSLSSVFIHALEPEEGFTHSTSHSFLSPNRGENTCFSTASSWCR
jgi:hypothetical protein